MCCEVNSQCGGPGVRVRVVSFSFSSRWHRSTRKVPYTLRPVCQQSFHSCPRNSANMCLVVHKSFSTLEGGMSAASFLHSSFLQGISAVMRWPVHVQKVPQASEHLCPAKLQTRCGICCTCQTICPFIPTDTGVPRSVSCFSSQTHSPVCVPVCDVTDTPRKAGKCKQIILSNHSIKSSYQIILSNHPIKSSYQIILSNHHIKSSNQIPPSV